MKALGFHNYYVYITTNAARTVLYTGVTNNLKKRLEEHKKDSMNSKKHFTGKYNAYHLLYWEHFDNIDDAIHREREIKGWKRERKENLILEKNPRFIFLEKEV